MKLPLTVLWMILEFTKIVDLTQHHFHAQVCCSCWLKFHDTDTETYSVANRSASHGRNVVAKIPSKANLGRSCRSTDEK